MSAPREATQECQPASGDPAGPAPPVAADAFPPRAQLEQSLGVAPAVASFSAIVAGSAPLPAVLAGPGPCFLSARVGRT